MDIKGTLLLAAESGDPEAMTQLGINLIDGRGMEQNSPEGQYWLLKAAETGHEIAIAELIIRLLYGADHIRNQDAGWSHINQYPFTNGDILTYIGVHSFLNTDWDTAGRLFYRAYYELHSQDAGINLVYMARRGALPLQIEITSIYDILSASLHGRNPLAIVNYALCLARGFRCEQDWSYADSLFASLTSSYRAVYDWWGCTLPPEDAERDLVIGWLCRYGFIADPDGLTLEQRFSKAGEQGWSTPEWIMASAKTAMIILDIE